MHDLILGFRIRSHTRWLSTPMSKTGWHYPKTYSPAKILYATKYRAWKNAWGYRKPHISNHANKDVLWHIRRLTWQIFTRKPISHYLSQRIVFSSTSSEAYLVINMAFYSTKCCIISLLYTKPKLRRISLYIYNVKIPRKRKEPLPPKNI